MAVNTKVGAERGATIATCASRLDWISTTADIKATPRPIAGAAERAADPGPARLARAIRIVPRWRPRARPAALAAATPRDQSPAKATMTPTIITAAAIGVGAVATARAAKPVLAARAPIISGPNAALIGAAPRNRVAGGVTRARARGARPNAAADNNPNTPALISGCG